MNKIVKQFESSYIGNGWGNYIDIENYKYDVSTMRPLPLVKKVDVYSYHIDINTNNTNNTNNNYTNNNYTNNYYKKKVDRAVGNLIIKVSSTTFITLFFTYFVFKII